MSEKQILKINENQLKQIVAESVKKVINESIRANEINADDVKGVEQNIIAAYEKIQELMYCELPNNAVEQAENGDKIDLPKEWVAVRSCLEQAFEHLRPIKYYMDIPFKNFFGRY